MNTDKETKTALMRISEWAACSAELTVAHRDIARKGIVDTFACMVAGIEEELPVLLVKAFCHGSSQGSPILFHDASAPPVQAALINATSAHATELDDWDSATEAHMSAVVVPALLAIIDPERTTGEDFVRAYLTGVEIGMICGEAINPGHLYGGWHPTSTIGALGAAGACANLLGLGAEGIAHAISLATTNAGLKCQVGTMVKPMFAGTAAQTGVQSALMAAAGVKGSLTALDGENSVEAIRSGGQVGGFDKVLENLGQKRWIDRFSLNAKPYPTCGILHRPIDGIALLQSENRFQVEDISRIDVRVSQLEFDYCGNQNPQDVAEARFSIAFAIARVVTDRKRLIDRLIPEMLQDATYQSLLPRVHVSVHPLAQEGNHYPPVEIVVCLNDGTRLQTSVQHAKGWPEAPMTLEDIQQKFQVNALPRLGINQTDQLLELLQSVDQLPHLADIIRLCRT